MDCVGALILVNIYCIFIQKLIMIDDDFEGIYSEGYMFHSINVT